MRIAIEWGYCTDGDFRVEPCDCIKPIHLIRDYDIFDFYESKVFDSKNCLDEVHCIFEASEYVKNLLVHTHVSSSHYWVIEEIYNMITPVIEFLGDRKSGEISRTMSGNYEGSFIFVGIYDE